MANHVHLCDYLFLAWSILKQYARKLTGWNLKKIVRFPCPNLPLLSSPFSGGREQIRSSVIMSYFHNVFLLGEPWSLRQGTSHDVTQASPDCWIVWPMRQNMVKSCSDVQQTWVSGCQKEKEPSKNHKCFRVVHKVNTCLTIWMHVKNAVYPLQKAHIYIRFVYQHHVCEHASRICLYIYICHIPTNLINIVSTVYIYAYTNMTTSSLHSICSFPFE